MALPRTQLRRGRAAAGRAAWRSRGCPCRAPPLASGACWWARTRAEVLLVNE